MADERPNYRSIKDVYDELKTAGVVSESLPEWSDKMNQITKTDLFSAGLHDNIIKRASVGVDRLLEQTPLPAFTKEFGGNVGAAFGTREAGEKIGEKLPRATLNMLPFLIPGAGWGAGAARLGLAGLMSGTESYTETGSPAAGVVSAATTAALPGVAGYGERLAAKYGYGKVGQFLGGQATATGFMEGEKVGESIVQGQVPENPLSVENLLNLTLGQVPFAAIHGTHKLLGRIAPSPDTVAHAVEAADKVQVQKEAARGVTEVEPPNPAVVRETQQRLAQLRGEQARLDPTNVEEANRLLMEEHDTLQQHTPTAQSVFGDTIAPDSPRQQVVGKELRSNGKWRAIEVADLPVNPEELRGKVVSYSTAYEPNPTARSDGHTVFGLPDAQWQTVKTPEEWSARKLQVDPNQPDLPVQEHPAEVLFSHLQDLKKVEIDADTAQTPADMQKAVVRLQGVQHENNIPPTNDATIKPLVDELTKSGNKNPVQTAVKVEARRTARILQAPPLSEKEAADIAARMGGVGFTTVSKGQQGIVGRISEMPKGSARPFSNIVEEAAYSVTSPHNAAMPEDVQMFRTLTAELGKTSDIGPDEIADVSEFIANRDGVPVAEAKDEVNAFLAKPHAKQWEQEVEARVQQMRQDHAAPDKPTKTFEFFKPTTEQEFAKVGEIGLTGNSLHQFLSKSTNPVVKNLFEGLKPYEDALKNVSVVVGEDARGSAFTRNLGNGKSVVVIPSVYLEVAPERLYYVAAHELVHGITLSELNNPTKASIVKDINDLRLRAIEKLPTSARGAYNRLVAEGWYKKWVKGAVIWDTIYSKGTEEQRQVLYGLIRTDEFVAQGLSRKSMQTYLKSIKDSQFKGVFGRFADTIKRLVGFKVEGTAFEDFLEHTGALIEHGDYVASFKEFAERHFEGQGLSDSMVQGQTRRALSVVINSGFGTSKEDIFSQLGNDVSVRSPELVSAKKSLNKLVNKANPAFVDVEQLMGELGFESSVKGHDDFVHEALMGRESKYSDALDMMPQEAKDYVFAKANDMKSVLDVLKAATEDSNKGLLNLADPATLRGPIREAMKAIDRIVQVQKVHELGTQLVQEAMAMAPDTYMEHLDEKVLADFGNEDPRKPGHLSLFLGQMSRMVRRFPVTAELADRAYELGPNAANMKSNILRVLGIDLRAGTQALSKEGLAESVKAVSTPRTLNAVNSWMYWNQEIARREKKGVTMLATNHPEIQKVLQGLNPQERAGVIDTVAKQSLSTMKGHAEVLEKMHQVGVAIGAKIVMKDTGLKTQESLGLTGQMFDAVRADRTNPQVAQQADAQIAIVQSKMTPEGFLELLKYTQSEAEKFKGWGDYFEANPAWATAQRLEQYLVSFTRGNKKLQLQASSIKEANILAKGGKHLEITDQWKDKEDDFPVLGPDADKWLERAAELEDNQLRSLVNKGYLDQAGADDFMRMSPKTQMNRELAAGQGGVPKFSAPPRLLSQGADELPFFWNHVAQADRVSNFWSRKLLRAQTSLHLADPDMVANPTLQKLMSQHVENVLKPDPSITRAITRFTSTWFMGFSPASAMMNGFQTITTAVPEMTSINGGRILDSYSKWGRALSAVSKESLPGGKWATEDHKWFAKQMSEAHEWDFSMYSDEAATQEAAQTNFKRMMMKQKPQNVGQKLSTAAGVYTNVGMWMFKSVERFNNKVASLMAFDHYMGEGLSREEALTEAKRFNRAVNYGGGRANRPVGAFAGEGDFSRSVAMLATNMQGYNLGVVGQIADYLQRGFFRPQGITPAEVYAARKAGLQMMSTQLVAAGALGLPFVSGALALVNQLFPDLEVNRHVREWAQDFFKGDSDSGGTLGDIALTGLPSMLGWDMQSRLSIGNVVPGVSEYNGFQPEQLLGPPANLVANFVGGVAKVAQGDPQGGEAFVPPGVRKLFQFVTNSGQLKDYKDRPLFTPTLGETAGIALGFNPKRLSDFNAASRIAEQNRLVSTRREGQQHQQLAEEVLAGNFGNVRQALLSRAESDKTFDPRNSVRSIAQAAEDLTFPRDLKREGTVRTSADRARLLSTFNLPPSSPSEVDRLNFRLQIMGRLGVRVDPRHELRSAAMVDELQRQNPTATRSELRREVETKLRRHPQNVSLLPE